MTRSEHETETLIRDSLDRLAARAPDGDAVRDALARAGRKPRPVARLALVAAAVVAVVVGVVVGTQAFTTADLDPAAGRPVLGYSPGWLPGGFTEQYREGGPGTAPQVRRWFAGPAEITLSAYSTADPVWSQTAVRIASLKDQVLVHGRVAMVTGDTAGAALLTWLADDDHVLTARVAGVPDARAVAQHVADSVTPAPVGVRGELRFGSLPAGLAERSAAVRGSGPGDASTELTAAAPGRPAVRVTASAGSPGVNGAAAVTVRGGPGFFVAPANGEEAMVAVRLPSGRWLTVVGPLAEAELVAVADAVQLDPSPDYRWLGRATS
ncbi:hypothetical protein Amsp01_086130 [Amycolatopsis sp. NBRC 101858]|uniref:hypothetical protein n=1 Tax=Amycolatopsis sp. NBRC 101858 TaxID=3032200 RepID=UPI0024A05825|nr:hypothetical protein [Amycolatopsis sp. NBRC 101858]GLY42590.1 hypothetical protein Amsp01_086130 [Amycolatopsis sp. NBRC 101858]